ncbi:MAG TPA: ABC transporter permease [Gemmataceae bacterium]|nr:ABC transporter permease [Gemmataceae bacterium]
MSRRHAFGQMILARLREFYREPEAIFWVYGFPLILAVLLGIAFSGGKPEPPTIDVQGNPDNEDVKKFVKTLEAGGLKDVQVHPEEECRRRLRLGKTVLFLVPGQPLPKFVYDETRAEGEYARYRVESILLRARSETLPPADVSPMSEPGSRYIDFLLPGLMGMNVMGGGLFGVGFILVDMRVRKLFKRLLATPMNRSDFLLAILVSRTIFLVPEMLALLTVGRLIFGVPIHGDLLTLTLVILAGSAAFDGIGLLLASRTEKTETISGLMNLVMLPMYLLSGTFFSSKRFPDAAQPFIQALPLTQLNDALRDVMLEGKSLTDVAWRLAILMAWALGSFALALRWFRWR